jgi:uncharacterized membrane protein YtjA (UPF0391 family)
MLAVRKDASRRLWRFSPPPLAVLAAAFGGSRNDTAAFRRVAFPPRFPTIGGSAGPTTNSSAKLAFRSNGRRDLGCLARSRPLKPGRTGVATMLKWALIFLVISIVAGLFGFTGISAASAGIAKILFYIFIVIFVIFLVLAITAGNAIL